MNLPRPHDTLSPAPLAELADVRTAVEALREELDAMAGYRERAATSRNVELRDMLEHHAREEAEHAAMLVEWLRRHEPNFKTQVAKFVGAQVPPMQAESDDAEARPSGVRELRLDPPEHAGAQAFRPIEVAHA